MPIKKFVSGATFTPGRTVRENFTTGSGPFRKAYLQSLINVIEVDDAQIRIKDSKDMLERAVLAGGTGAVGSSQMSTRWRAILDEDEHYVYAIAL